MRLEIYSSRSAPLRRLVREFGGKVEKIDAEKIIARSTVPRRPLLLAADLAVIDAHGSWTARRPKPRILLRIGGAMAFGTGEHATTAACLRFLRDEAWRLAPGWTALDIGTGSGILAIAAEKLGAARIDAFDNDPRAVGAARLNMRRNRCGRITLAVTDVLAWRSHPSRYPVVMANVYSEVLRAAAARIARAVAPGGCLILSGILRDRAEETLGDFLAQHLVAEKTARRGKWVTMQLRRPGRTSRAAGYNAARFSRRTARSASCSSGKSSRIAKADK